MTDPRDQNPINPELERPADPDTQSYLTGAQGEVAPPAGLNAGVAYGRTGTYSPVYEPRTQWAPEWQQGTPQHWLEPLPGQDRRRGQRPGALYTIALIVVALIAGAVGSAGTY